MNFLVSLSTFFSSFLPYFFTTIFAASYWVTTSTTYYLWADLVCACDVCYLTSFHFLHLFFIPFTVVYFPLLLVATFTVVVCFFLPSCGVNVEFGVRGVGKKSKKKLCTGTLKTSHEHRNKGTIKQMDEFITRLFSWPQIYILALFFPLPWTFRGSGLAWRVGGWAVILNGDPELGTVPGGGCYG